MPGFVIKMNIRPTSVMPDPDLREYQREMALFSREGCSAKPPAVLPINRKTRSNLFSVTHQVEDPSEWEGELLSIAIERSLDDNRPTLSKTTPVATALASYDSSDDIYEEITPPSRLETALTFAGTSQSPSRISPKRPGLSPLVFGKPNLSPSPQHSSASRGNSNTVRVNELSPGPSTATKALTGSSLFGTPTLLSTEKAISSPTVTPFDDNETQPTTTTYPMTTPVRQSFQLSSDSEEEMEEVFADASSTAPILGSTLHHAISVDSHDDISQIQESYPPPSSIDRPTQPLFGSDDGDDEIEWSRTPSPVHDPHLGSSAANTQGWDAANEMDAQVEEGEFARFISQVKGKRIEDVRKEIDDEINDLNRQRRAAMRDSDDPTQQMIAQIMVGFCYLLLVSWLKNDVRQCCAFSGFLISLPLWRLKPNALNSCR